MTSNHDSIEGLRLDRPVALDCPPTSLTPGRIIYRPPSVYLPYAVACKNAVLQNSMDARRDYTEIVRLCGLPEYQALLDDLCRESHITATTTEMDLVNLFPDLLNSRLDLPRREYAVWPAPRY